MTIDGRRTINEPRVDRHAASDLDSVVPFLRHPWRRRIRAWRGWLITLGLAAAVAAVIWAVFFSPLLALRTVEVQGTHDISSRQVTTAAHLAPGTPLARISVSSVQARVEAIPSVASATVRRGWPHTIVISVTERQPVAVVRQDGAWWVMDKTGVLFAKAGLSSPGEPIVELVGRADPRTLPQVGSVLGALPPALLTSTRRVTASSMDSITLVLKNGSQVRWGSAADSAQKAAVLHGLMGRHARIYDVTIPSQPATVN